MGHGDDVGRFQDGLIGEVRDISGHLSGEQRLGHILIVYHLSPGLVDDAHALFHLGKGLGVEHVVGLFCVGDIDADIIRVLVNLVHGFGMDGLSGQLPGGVHGHKGVVAVDHHA